MHQCFVYLQKLSFFFFVTQFSWVFFAISFRVVDQKFWRIDLHNEYNFTIYFHFATALLICLHRVKQHKFRYALSTSNTFYSFRLTTNMIFFKIHWKIFLKCKHFSVAIKQRILVSRFEYWNDKSIPRFMFWQLDHSGSLFWTVSCSRKTNQMIISCSLRFWHHCRLNHSFLNL